MAVSGWPPPSRAAPDGPDLAVHHPRGRHDVGAGVGLRQRRPGVELDGGVVVDVACRRQHAAVAVVGVLVEAAVGHEHHPVAHLVAQVAQRDLHDAVGVPGLGPGGVLASRHAEQDHAGHAERGQRRHLLAEALTGVLHDAGQRRDGLRFGDALAHEERGDEVVDAEAGLGHQPAQRRRGAQPPGPVIREGHGPILRPRPAGHALAEASQGDIGQRCHHEVGAAEVVVGRHRPGHGHGEEPGPARRR